MKPLLFAASLLVSVLVFAQTDSLRSAILNYEDQDLELIIKGRKMLKNELSNDNMPEARKIVNFLLEETQESKYPPFTGYEGQILYYLTGKFEIITDLLEDYYQDSYYQGTSFDYMRDGLAQEIEVSAIANESRIRESIQQSSLSSEEKAIVTLHFDYLLSFSEDLHNYQLRQNTQNDLNSKANNFLETYPESPYETYVRNEIRYIYERSNWGFAFEFFSGYGIFNSDLEDSFSDNVPIGIAFDVEYKNWALYLRDYIGLHKTKIDIPHREGIWEKNSQARTYLGEASLGYVSVDNNLFKVAPFAGIGTMGISPTEYDIQDDRSLRKADLKFTQTYIFGVNLDLKIGATKVPIIALNEESFWFIRIRYAYTRPQFTWKYDSFHGDMHYITIGFGGFGSKLKRKI